MTQGTIADMRVTWNILGYDKKINSFLEKYNVTLTCHGSLRNECVARALGMSILVVMLLLA